MFKKLNVKQNVKEDTNTLIVWALGAYPVEREDYNIEMTLFALASSDDRDHESQAVFVKDNFFSVGGKIVPRFYKGNKRVKMIVSSSTHLTILNKVESNKCLLKVSLLGIPQEALNVIKEDAVVQILIFDYVSQEVNFNVKVVFPCCSTRFAYMKNNIWPRDSFIFVVGQLEIIKNEFYIYARDINCIDAQFISKKNVFDRNIPYGSSSKNSVRSKLLATYDNFAEYSKNVSENRSTLPTVLNDNNNKFKLNSLSNDTLPSKCVRVEDFDDSVEEFFDDF
ncbi:hypothetical protein C2G38_2145188 [Gigaspora rosea]|uniref:Uncharacterized protein n=1 Tax=Gigaspora rosea TaxID=44941 RepID=A0A397UQV5_9GLOM|nr:hypothetical protein C2G38_2145188 [Gigaspora rosea]